MPITAEVKEFIEDARAARSKQALSRIEDRREKLYKKISSCRDIGDLRRALEITQQEFEEAGPFVSAQSVAVGGVLGASIGVALAKNSLFKVVGSGVAGAAILGVPAMCFENKQYGPGGAEWRINLYLNFKLLCRKLTERIETLEINLFEEQEAEILLRRRRAPRH